MNLWLTKDEHEALVDRLKIAIKEDGECLKDHDSFSHGDWLRIKFTRDRYLKILKKLGAKKWSQRPSKK